MPNPRIITQHRPSRDEVFHRAGIHTEPKIYLSFCVGLTDCLIGVPQGENMSVQELKLRKNFIAILSDKTEEQRAIASLTKSDRAVKDYFLGLMAAVLNRHGGAK